MNLGELVDSLDQAVRDKSLEPFFAGWINNAILEVASDFELPSLKLLTPYPLEVDTSNWLWVLPENFHKKLFRCAGGSDFRHVKVFDRIEDLDRLNLKHDQIADYVGSVATAMQGENHYLGNYPLANDVLQLWFYRKPAYLEQDKDVPDCIPSEFHERVILPRGIIKAYQYLQDQVENFDPKPLQYWEGKKREGLYGSPQGDIGFINYLTKLRGGPKRHGGRDPIGARGGRW